MDFVLYENHINLTILLFFFKNEKKKKNEKKNFFFFFLNLSYKRINILGFKIYW